MVFPSIGQGSPYVEELKGDPHFGKIIDGLTLEEGDEENNGDGNESNASQSLVRSGFPSCYTSRGKILLLASWLAVVVCSVSLCGTMSAPTD